MILFRNDHGSPCMYSTNQNSAINSNDGLQLLFCGHYCLTDLPSAFSTWTLCSAVLGFWDLFSHTQCTPTSGLCFTLPYLEPPNPRLPQWSLSFFRYVLKSYIVKAVFHFSFMWDYFHLKKALLPCHMSFSNTRQMFLPYAWVTAQYNHYKLKTQKVESVFAIPNL